MKSTTLSVKASTSLCSHARQHLTAEKADLKANFATIFHIVSVDFHKHSQTLTAVTCQHEDTRIYPVLVWNFIAMKNSVKKSLLRNFPRKLIDMTADTMHGSFKLFVFFCLKMFYELSNVNSWRWA